MSGNSDFFPLAFHPFSLQTQNYQWEGLSSPAVRGQGLGGVLVRGRGSYTPKFHGSH